MIVRVVTTPDELNRCVEIRRAVFIEEQGVAETIELDGLDDACTHFLAWPDDAAALRHAVGTARFRITENGHAKAQRVAVLKAFRGAGYGRALMQAVEQHARQLGHRELVLNAQLTARPCYGRLAYEARGEVFLEAGIEHITMYKHLID